jgi:HSP20 family molecular chaperone IbpA
VDWLWYKLYDDLLIKARPDSFLPAVDIIATDKYIIYMDVPGLTKDEILVYR